MQTSQYKTEKANSRAPLGGTMTVQRLKERFAALCEAISGLLGVFFLLLWPVPMLACLCVVLVGSDQSFGCVKLALLGVVCGLASVGLRELRERLRKK